MADSHIGTKRQIVFFPQAKLPGIGLFLKDIQKELF